MLPAGDRNQELPTDGEQKRRGESKTSGDGVRTAMSDGAHRAARCTAHHSVVVPGNRACCRRACKPPLGQAESQDSHNMVHTPAAHAGSRGWAPTDLRQTLGVTTTHGALDTVNPAIDEDSVEEQRQASARCPWRARGTVAAPRAEEGTLRAAPRPGRQPPRTRTLGGAGPPWAGSVHAVRTGPARVAWPRRPAPRQAPFTSRGSGQRKIRATHDIRATTRLPHEAQDAVRGAKARAEAPARAQGPACRHQPPLWRVVLGVAWAPHGLRWAFAWALCERWALFLGRALFSSQYFAHSAPCHVGRPVITYSPFASSVQD